MDTATSIPTEALLAIGLKDGRSVVREIVSAPPVGLRELAPSAEAARVAVVQTAATLVDGDDLTLRMVIAPGARAIVTEISATLAHPVRASAPILQELDLELGRGSSLVFLEQPLIIASATKLERTLRVRLRAGAQMLHRETLVLGRSEEETGAARLRTRVTIDDRPLLDETIDTGDSTVLRTPAVLGGAHVVGTLSILGSEPQECPPACSRLAGPGMVLRQAASRFADLRLGSTEAAWIDFTMRCPRQDP